MAFVSHYVFLILAVIGILVWYNHNPKSGWNRVFFCRFFAHQVTKKRPPNGDLANDMLVTRTGFEPVNACVKGM